MMGLGEGAVKGTESYAIDSLGEWRPGSYSLCLSFHFGPSSAQRMLDGHVGHSKDLRRLRLTLAFTEAFLSYFLGISGFGTWR